MGMLGYVLACSQIVDLEAVGSIPITRPIISIGYGKIIDALLVNGMNR